MLLILFGHTVVAAVISLEIHLDTIIQPKVMRCSASGTTLPLCNLDLFKAFSIPVGHSGHLENTTPVG